MRRYAILALLLTTLPAGRVSATENFNPKSTGLPIGGGTMAGDIDMNGHNLLNMGDWYHDILTADVLPDADLIKAQDSWSQSTTPANYVGAPLYLGGGLGAKYITITAAGSGGNTIVVTHNDAQNAGANTTTTYTSDAGGWVCSTETDADCTLNLLTIVLASPVPGWTASCADGTCSTAVLYFQPDAGTHYMLVSETGATFTATNRASGLVLMPANSAAVPVLAFANDPDTGIGLSGTNYIAFYSGGAKVVECNASQCYFTGALNLTLGTGMVNWNGATELRAGAGSAQDGALLIQRADEAWGAQLYASAANELTIRDMVGGDTGELVVTGRLSAMGSLLVRQSTDFPSDGAYLLKIDSMGSAEFTASSGRQYAIFGEGTEILQTGTAGFTYLYGNTTDSSSGSAQDYWIEMEWDLARLFAVQDDGDMLLHEDPGSDTPALDGRIFGANAWAQATAGVNRNGADVHVAAGIRTLQLVCSDPTKTALDDIVITTDGADTTLTEGTHFVCFGQTAEVCCDNVGTATTTAVATTKMVPDCDTTAGTCYLTPHEDVLAVDDVAYVDNGADGVGFTLTEGADSAVVLHGIHNALRVTSNGSGNTLLQLGGTTASFPAIQRNSLYLEFVKADNSGFTSIYADNLIGAGYVRAGAADSFYFVGRTKWTSLGGDGIWEMGQNDGTQNARFDTATTDNVLILGTESDTTIGLQNIAGWWDLQADGDLVLDNPGATVNSPTFSLKGDDGGVEEEASFQLLQGADPYLQISVTDDSATPALLPVIDIHDTLIAPSSGGATVNLGNSTNYFTQFYGIYATLQDQINPSHGLSLKWDEDGAADYHLGFKVNGASRTIDLTGNLTVEAASIINQDLSTDSTTAALGSISLDSITSTESDIAERITDSAKVTTTDALDNLIASVTLADGEVLTVEVTILGRERDGSDRNVYHIQGLFYRQGAGAVQQGVSTYIAEVESDVDWCGDLAVSGNDVQITVDGNGDTVDWEITYTYQILVSAV